MEEREETADGRVDRAFDVCRNALLAAALLAALAGCWLLVRGRERARLERILRDPHGAEARVEGRLMAGDAAYRACRRAAGAVFGPGAEALP